MAAGVLGGVPFLVGVGCPHFRAQEEGRAGPEVGGGNPRFLWPQVAGLPAATSLPLERGGRPPCSMGDLSSQPSAPPCQSPRRLHGDALRSAAARG